MKAVLSLALVLICSTYAFCETQAADFQEEFQLPETQTPATVQAETPLQTPTTVQTSAPKSMGPKIIKLGCLDLGIGGMDLVYNDFLYGIGTTVIMGLTRGNTFKAGFGYRADIYTDFLVEYTDKDGRKVPGHSLAIDFIIGATGMLRISDALTIGLLIGPEANLELISARILNFGFGFDLCFEIATGGPKIGLGAAFKAPVMKFWNFYDINDFTSPWYAFLPYVGIEI